ncbi:protein translocase subunit SecD [bacterium]|nr:protein translocase subunit SecD [bacterium]MBU1676699.1 protein translocase subunit SecD [bacterium]
MNRSFNLRALLVIVVVLLSLWGLYPTLRASRVTDQMREQALTDPALKVQIDNWEARAIRKGLDLEGGMYIVLEIDTEDLTSAQASDALDRVVEILRNRVDQFGVSEPDIKPLGSSRIIVQLPGLQDVDRAKRLIGSTARLEFRMVRPVEDLASVLTKLDEAFAVTGTAEADTTVAAEPAAGKETETAAADTSGVDTAAPGADEALDFESLPEQPGEGLAGPTDAQLATNPFTAYMLVDQSLIRYMGTPIVVQEQYLQLVRNMLEAPEAHVIPRNMEFQFDMEPHDLGGGFRARPLYLLDKRPGLTGDRLVNARSAPDTDHPGNFQVHFSLDRKGARIFAKLSGENIGRNMAISLDGKVKSAPVFSSKIPTGDGVITGSFSSMEAQDMALLLRAGALPVDVRIEEERTVGPSLGRDSIHQGLEAALYGLLLVVIFVVFYYRLTGLVVVLAVTVNVLILLAVLVQFGLVLTLPGIAGIILTIGMAVDANVLINERIREELRRNKTSRAAVDSGYANATRTIVDANVTTLIAAGILLWFGTGPIQGFAVTLSIGILSSMFTALVLTRVIMEAATRNRSHAKLSI